MINNTMYLTGGKSPNPLTPPTNLAAKAGNAQVTLTWTDPPNATSEPSGQTIATWAYTQVVRKEGSQPTGPSDGTLVIKSSVRDQYQTTGYIDTNLTNDTLYYYGAFAYNSDGVYSEGAFVSATPVAGIPVGELAVGSIIKINESGAPIEYMVVNQGLPGSMYDSSCDGTWVLRQNVSGDTQWDSGPQGKFQDSSIYNYMNNTFYSYFDSSTQDHIKQINIYAITGNSWGTLGQVPCKIFPLSTTELGLIGLPYQNEGAQLNYFESGTGSEATSKRASNGDWWTRSIINTFIDNRVYIQQNGTASELRRDYSSGARPAFILTEDSKVDANMNLIV